MHNKCNSLKFTHINNNTGNELFLKNAFLNYKIDTFWFQLKNFEFNRGNKLDEFIQTHQKQRLFSQNLLKMCVSTH